MTTRLLFADLGRYGFSDLDLAPCCHFFSGDKPYFVLCLYHEGFVYGYVAALADAGGNQSDLPASATPSDSAPTSRTPRGLHLRRRG
jgi:hypothetical protein